MQLSDVLFIGNALFIVTVAILVFFIIRYSSLWTLNVGDYPKQTVLKWKILKLLVALATTGFVAVVFNVSIVLLQTF